MENRMENVLLISSALLLMDTLFSLYYFKYTYFLELKRRYAASLEVPIAYRQKLKIEIENEVGFFRRLIQASYIPWFIFCFFTQLWILPFILSIILFVTNLFYSKPYISPIALIIELLTFFMAYGFTIMLILSRFV